jgi:ureidoacrylate peracid hydrolase
MSFTEPYRRGDWRLVPGRTVHVIIDAQNDFLHPSGWYAKAGVDISHMQRVVAPIKALNVECRRHGVPIVWTRHGFRDERDGGTLVRLRPFLRDGGLRVDTWGYDVLEDLEPRRDDWFVAKNRLSAFFQSNLELILRNLGAETVIFSGVLTNQCVAATSKDASFRDFLPVVVEEATGTTLPHLHAPAIEMIAVGWGEVATLDQTLAALKTFPETA